MRPCASAITPNALRRHLETRNIESRPLWKPLQPLFSAAPRYGGAVCASLFARGLCLPSGTALGDAELRRVKEALVEGLQQSAFWHTLDSQYFISRIVTLALLPR